jgi:hypothetical protein
LFDRALHRARIDGGTVPVAKKGVRATELSLWIVSIVVVAPMMLAPVAGADSRDGNDWMKHPNWRQR